VRLSSAYPWQHIFRLYHWQLMAVTATFTYASRQLASEVVVVGVFGKFPCPQQFVILERLPPAFHRVERRVEDNAVRMQMRIEGARRVVREQRRAEVQIEGNQKRTKFLLSWVRVGSQPADAVFRQFSWIFSSQVPNGTEASSGCGLDPYSGSNSGVGAGGRNRPNLAFHKPLEINRLWHR